VLERFSLCLMIHEVHGRNAAQTGDECSTVDFHAVLLIRLAPTVARERKRDSRKNRPIARRNQPNLEDLRLSRYPDYLGIAPGSGR
jgi:hypothetical protein